MTHRKAAGAVRWIIISGSIATAIVVAIAIFWLSRPVVTVTRVVEGPAVSSFYATGTVEPVTEYPVKTSNAGIITKEFVDKGDRVSKGQPLAIVEDPQLQFALDKANANLKQAQLRADPKSSPVLAEFDARMQANESMLDSAKREEKRFTDMAGKGGASKSDQDRAADRVKDLWSQGISLASQREASRIQLETDLRIAEAAVRAAQSDVDRQTLRSPIDGVVLDRPVPLGTRLAVNMNDHVMQLADVRPENLVMRAAVDEENKPDLRLGQTVRMALYSFPGKVFKGAVTRIYDKADVDRRTFEVDVKFDVTENTLSAGMTGELAFILAEKERALIAPAQSLQHGNLFTVRDGRLHRVDGAGVGLKSVERIELTSGFQLGDIIVISPVQDLHEGAPVRTKTIDPKIAAGLNSPKTDSTFKGFN